MESNFAVQLLVVMEHGTRDYRQLGEHLMLLNWYNKIQHNFNEFQDFKFCSKTRISSKKNHNKLNRFQDS